MRIIYYSVVLTLGFILTGCSSLLSPAKSVAQNTYTLDAVSTDKYSNSNSRYTLLVAASSASAVNQSTNMLYTNKRYQINHFANNRWAAPPAQMLTPLLVQTLRNTNYFRAVIAAPFANLTNFRLETQLLQLQQDFTSKPSQMKVKIKAQLINNQNSNILFDRTFTAVVTADQDNPYGGVIAANIAVRKITQQIAMMCVRYARSFKLRLN